MAMQQSRYIQVQATSFSGTTLLAMLLGAHPQIATVGEMNGLQHVQVERYLCSCGVRMRKCPFWQAVTAQMQQRGFAFDIACFDTRFLPQAPAFLHALRQGSSGYAWLDATRDALFGLWPGETRALQRLALRNQALVEIILALTGSTVFVDTSKEALRLPSLRKFSTLDIGVIHWVRDVRGFVASTVRRRGAGAFPIALRRWVRLHQRTLRLLTTWPADRQLRVRYEDLCCEPQPTLARIFRFCGVDPALYTEEEQEKSQHIIGNPTRLRGTVIRLDERWRQQLSADQLLQIERQAGQLNRFFGYEP
jgi:hypothetical protein